MKKNKNLYGRGRQTHRNLINGNKNNYKIKCVATQYATYTVPKQKNDTKILYNADLKIDIWYVSKVYALQYGFPLKIYS